MVGSFEQKMLKARFDQDHLTDLESLAGTTGRYESDTSSAEEIKLGRPTFVSDESGHTRSHQYDASGRIRFTNDPGQTFEAFCDNAQGQVTRQRDGSERVIQRIRMGLLAGRSVGSPARTTSRSEKCFKSRNLSSRKMIGRRKTNNALGVKVLVGVVSR